MDAQDIQNAVEMHRDNKAKVDQKKKKNHEYDTNLVFLIKLKVKTQNAPTITIIRC